MARDSSIIQRDDLLDLDDSLLDEGFGFLMSLLPRELFQLYNERIVIIESLLHEIHDQKKNQTMVFAYFTESDEHVRALTVDVDAAALAKYDFPPSLKRRKGGPLVELVHIGQAQIDAFRNVPPLSWHKPMDPSYERSPECRDHTIALIKYYLLVWASKNEYAGPLPQPNQQHLVSAFARLRTTNHYRNKVVMNEDDERLDVHMCLRKGGDFRPLGHLLLNGQREPAIVSLEKDDTKAGHSARTSRESSKSYQRSGESEEHQQLIDSAKLPTPHQTPKQPTLDLDMVDSTEASTRGASVASAGNTVLGAELAAMDSLDTNGTLNLETEAPVRESLPTPDTLVEEAVVETDPTLRDIQKKMGHDTLSVLPLLATCTFKTIQKPGPGFLGLRLLLGTFREDTSRTELEGCEAWACFRLHDKNDRAAPRMHVHAYRAGTENVVDDDIKTKDVLPDLILGPAFNSIQGGDRAEELLLKALVKYFFIIAARDKLLGFEKHKMPFNSSFVDQLTIACKRLQMRDSSRDDQRAHNRPFKRVKRSHNPTPRASTSLSDADDDMPATRTRDTRRSGRRTGQSSSAAVSESEDYLPACIPAVPQHVPRRLALGVRIVPLMEGPAVNEFLDPEADPVDSDGDSGDEIPPPISQDTCAFLRKRYISQTQMKNIGELVKYYRNRKESTIMGIRKVKGTLNKHVMAPADRLGAERGLAHRRMCETTIGTHLAMKEEELDGWKARVKEVNKEAAAIDPRVIETWDMLYKA